MIKIDIFGKDIDLDEPLKVFVQEKIGGLEHLLQNAGEVSAHVEIGKSTQHHRTGPFYYAEVNMKLGGTLLRASCSHEDLRNAITDVKHELEAQIRKFKEKREDLERQPKE